MNYVLSQLCEQVMTARANYKSIEIVGGHSKSFYGNQSVSDDEVFRLEMSALSGVVSYEPSELVLTAMAGTPLSQIEATLAENDQMLAFDPPCFGPNSTIGGVVASGLSGPLSFGYGPLRHYVLGTHLLDAQGRILKFGGEVMKNVAGYDVSRLLTGSLGMFGAIVQVSLKVLPRPLCDVTQAFELTQQDALALCENLKARPIPVKAAAWLPADDQSELGQLSIRLCGAQAAVSSAVTGLGGDSLGADEAKQWWDAFRDQKAAFFNQTPLWRLAVRARTPQLAADHSAFDLGGQVRWLVTQDEAQVVRDVAAGAGGHATLFRALADQVPGDGVFQPLAPSARAIVKRLKQELDPKSIFNPGRLVAGI